MDGFEIGRRRPLHKRVEKDTKPPTPIYDTVFEEEEYSLSFINKWTNNLADKNSSNRKKRHTSSHESNPHKLLPPIEVDLHIYELVDSTTGMDNYAMLQLQLDTVRKTMRNHYRRIGQKIIFIHGKGDGVLRKEVRKLIAKEYASCDVQDASFLKYGFGATEIIVRQR